MLSRPCESLSGWIVGDWPRKHATRPLVALACFALAMGVLRFAAPAYSQAQGDQPGKYLGAGKCIECHTAGQVGNRTEDFVLLTEFATWRTQDRHAFAYLALLGPRAKQMGDILKRDVTKKETGCLGCHSMDFVPENRRGEDFNFKDGVTCDGCHGPAENWLSPHQTRSVWRLKTAAEKEKLGMTDLRDPVKRSAICLECHVGNAENGKVVTHAMFAAGHPPLPNFETGYFSRNLPQHWRDKKDVPFFKDPAAAKLQNAPADLKERVAKLYHLNAGGFQHAQCVLASSLAGLQAEANLIAGRADFRAGNAAVRWPELAMQRLDGGKDPTQLWPELAMAHSDCYACHHELQRPSWRQTRGYPGKPGRPPVRLWPLELPGLDIGLNGAQEKQQLVDQLQALNRACDEQPFGLPKSLVPAARLLADWSAKLAEKNANENAKPSHVSLLRKLCGQRPQAYPDYDSARQIAAAIVTVSAEWPGKPPGDTWAKALAALEKDFALQPDTGRRDRLLLVKQKFEEVTKEKYLADASAQSALERVASKGILEAFKDPGQDAVKRELTRFLDALLRQGAAQFTEALLKDEGLAKALDKLNEQEPQTSLRRMSDYDPLRFRQQLEALEKLLPKGDS